ncbi:MAG: hypothetical protein NTX66_01995 [Candidatus Falkowbacteria bacterium]|nr:hypothetical protein [Candidatus Falkowbacteria bacterium]
MDKITRDFVSQEKRKFKFSLGGILASSLSGFIAGIVITLIVVYTLCDVTLK